MTHLVCTKEEFDKMGPKGEFRFVLCHVQLDNIYDDTDTPDIQLVKEALKRVHKKEKRCHIVSLDWLEDSLFADRRLPEDSYSHVATQKALKDKKRLEKKIAKGVEEEERAVNSSKSALCRRSHCCGMMRLLADRYPVSDFYSVYWDPSDFFQYEITLSRDDEEMGVLGERYVVKVSSRAPWKLTSEGQHH